jgi:uncharacterized protein YqcC (DUF446 family)
MSETRDELARLLCDTRRSIEQLRRAEEAVHNRGDYAPYHALAIQREHDTEREVLSAIARLDQVERGHARR